jgi:hypothetical protein
MASFTFPRHTKAALDLLEQNTGADLAGIGTRDGMLSLRFTSPARVALAVPAQELDALINLLPPRFEGITLAGIDRTAGTFTISTLSGVHTLSFTEARVLDQVL